MTGDEAAALIGVDLSAGVSAVYTYPEQLRDEWLARADAMGAEWPEVADAFTADSTTTAFVVYNLEVARQVRTLIALEMS